MDERLLAAARQARERAYAPYSRYRVGAAILGANGKVYAGCNVENAAYPQGCCAEASAISAMVGDGERRIAALLVIAEGEVLVTPCGGCRQRIREFAGDEVPIHLGDSGGVRQSVTLGALFPLSFGPRHLG